MGSVHVTIGTNDDLAYLRQAVAESGTVIWPVPKPARPGDEVFFLLPFLTGDLTAVGIVQGATSPCVRWAPKYEAEIGEVRFLDRPIPIAELQERFPDWKYLMYARGYTTVPIKLHPALGELVKKRLERKRPGHRRPRR